MSGAEVDIKELATAERINVVGTSGSGKSTFSRALAERLGLPHHEMDAWFWKAGWVAATDAELEEKVREATAEPRWVLDGNYTRTIPLKWEKVQVVVWLDLGFGRTVGRVIRRTLRRAWRREEIWPGTGNRESVWKTFFTTDSIIWWAITSYRGSRAKYAELMASPEHSSIDFLRLRTPAEVGACLEALGRGS